MTHSTHSVHGFDFIADTMDWRDKDDAARAESGLIEIIHSFTASEAAELHCLLSSAANGDVDWSHPKLSALQRRCLGVCNYILREYVSQPAVGHNCDILAG